MSRSFQIAILGVLGLLAGCSAATAGRFTAQGYENSLYGYRVKANPAAHVLDPAEWVIDNYRRDAQGNPTTLEEAELSEVAIDANQDGTVETSHEHPAVDLRYVHRQHDGQIWISTLPVNTDLALKDLRVMLRRMVQSMSGTGRFSLYGGDGASAAQDKRFATRIVAESPALLSGYPAHHVLVEIASVEELELSPDMRWQRVELILARTDYTWSGGSRGAFPVYVAVGYRNLPEDFERGRTSFHDLVHRIELEPPPGFPEQLRRCVAGSGPIHAVEIERHAHPRHSDKIVTRLGTHDGSPATRRCLGEYAVGLPPPAVPDGREPMYVANSLRKGSKTELQELAFPDQGPAAEPPPPAQEAPPAGGATPPEPVPGP